MRDIIRDHRAANEPSDRERRKSEIWRDAAQSSAAGEEDRSQGPFLDLDNEPQDEWDREVREEREEEKKGNLYVVTEEHPGKEFELPPEENDKLDDLGTDDEQKA